MAIPSGAYCNIDCEPGIAFELKKPNLNDILRRPVRCKIAGRECMWDGIGVGTDDKT